MNKKLIAILTLAVFMLTLMPMGAFAVTKNTTVGAVPNVRDTGTVTLSSVRINEDVAGNLASGDTFVLTLPSGVEWQAVGVVQAAADAANGAGDVTVTRTTSRVLNVVINNAALTAGVDVVVLPTPVDVTTVGTGDIVINVAAPGTAITEGDLTIGRFVSGRATVSMLSTPSRGEGNVTMGTIRITEVGLQSLNGRTIIMKLPNNVTWNTPAITTSNLTTWAVAGDGTRTLTITPNSAGQTNQTIIDIVANVTVGSSANKGDVEVSFSGTSDLSDTVKIGSFAEWGYTVSAATAKAVESGKDTQRIANVTVKEDIAGSLVPNRTVSFELPKGVVFTAAPQVRLEAGNNIWATAAATLNTDADKATVTLTGTQSTTAAEIRLYNADVNIAPSFSGDLTVKVAGSAGVAGEFVVGTAKKVATIETEPAEIKIGVQGQMLQDLYIKENYKEALVATAVAPAPNNTSDVILRLPSGFAWSKTPSASVTEGNLEINSVVTRANSNRDVVIRISGESTVASTIKLSNLAITTDRSVPEGNVNVTLMGGAVVQNAVVVDNTENAGSFKVATVTTPAEDGVVQPVVMTVGSTVYTVDGVEMMMDVAPYVKEGRTFFPVRYVASAVGITADNVVWDAAQRTVTIFRGNRIVQVTIGSNTMLVNGIPLTMDVAPEITAERTMLPIRFVAQGLNVNVTFDAATQTVTLN